MSRPHSGPLILVRAFLLLLAAVPCAAGVIVTVPLDLGDGEFEISTVSRLEQDFAGSQAWPVVDDVQLHLVGRHTCQYIQCAENTTPMPSAAPSAVAFGFMVDGVEVHRTTQVFPCVAEGEDFDLILPFAVREAPDWSFLATGTGTLFVEHQATPDHCIMFPQFWGVDAHLTGVELLVDLPDGVPVAGRPWGSLKAQYR